MTQVMEALKVGDSMEVKGPLGHFIYQGRGSYKHSGKAGTCRQLSMIAGGTGITPMWQVIQVTSLFFLCCCHSPACTCRPLVGLRWGRPSATLLPQPLAVAAAVGQQCLGLHGTTLLGLFNRQADVPAVHMHCRATPAAPATCTSTKLPRELLLLSLVPAEAICSGI